MWIADEPMNEALEQEFDFYRGAGRGEVLDQLTHLAAWARSLVMLTGPEGAGKSLLLEQVIARVAQTGRSIIVRPPVGFLSTGYELLRHVAADLGVKVTDGLDEAGLQRVAMQQIVAELASDRSTLLLLDDAHELSADVLRTVARLVDEARDSRGLNVLLAGEPSLPDQLRKATPARENWHEIRLRPFALNDMRSFLRQRLPQSAAGLDTSGMNALARKTGGWPGRILAVFNGQPRKRSSWPRRIPLLHVGLLLVLTAALATAVWFQRFREVPVTPPAVNNRPQTEVETLALPNAEPRVGVATNGSGARMTLPTSGAASGVAGAAPSGPARGTVQSADDPAQELPPSQRIPVPKPPPELTMPEPPPAPMLKLPGATVAVPAGSRPPAAGTVPVVAANARVRLPNAEPSSAAPGTPVAVVRSAKPAPGNSTLPGNASLSVERPSAVDSAATVPTSSASTVSAAALPAPTASAAAAASPAPPASSKGAGDNAWLNSQPPANFTVQVMGVSAASAAQSYLRRHPNAGLRIIRTVRDGRDWYVVVKGSFSGRGEAQGAVKELKGANAQPWVRTIDGIQRDTRGP